VRTSLSAIAVDDAASSPLIGYGDTRHQLGSTNSIAVGKTLKCHSCGSRDIGGNGQLWMMLISSGFLGAGLYCAFFLYGIWRYWRDPTPYGLAGRLLLLRGVPVRWAPVFAPLLRGGGRRCRGPCLPPPCHERRTGKGRRRRPPRTRSRPPSHVPG